MRLHNNIIQHIKTRQKVPDARRGDDGVQASTPRSRNEAAGALSRVYTSTLILFTSGSSGPCIEQPFSFA